MSMFEFICTELNNDPARWGAGNAVDVCVTVALSACGLALVCFVTVVVTIVTVGVVGRPNFASASTIGSPLGDPRPVIASQPECAPMNHELRPSVTSRNALL